MNCIFCQQKLTKDRTIHKDKLIFVMLTNIPIVPGHLLICPVRHVESVNDLKPKEQLAIFEIIKKLQPILKKSFKATGFNFAWNQGKDAGQNFSHLHIHMLPRKKGDKGITKYDPRKFLYRPGSRAISADAELTQIVQLIQKNLKLKKI